MLPEKFLQVLAHDGVVGIATQGATGPHLVNTWNSYLQITGDKLLIPAGRMHQTEKNIAIDSVVLLTAGTREVEGFHGPGTGFLIKGIAKFVFTGANFELVKNKFPWARAALEITVNNSEQTL